MYTEKTADLQTIIARIISIIFHPLFMPLYGMLIIFSAPTLFWYLPLKVKKILFIVLLVNNVLIPFALMPYLRYSKIINSWIVGDRRGRTIPLLTVTLLYSITSFIMFRFQIPVFIKAFIFSTSFLTLSVAIINFWWKISLHAVGAGALTGVVMILYLKMYIPLLWHLIPVVLIAGLILSARLKLNSHNSARVYLGFLTGLAGMDFFMLLF